MQYVSHKLGRLAVPYALVALFCSNVLIAGTHLMYQASLVAQVGFYLLAGYGAVLEFISRGDANLAASEVRAASASAAHTAKGAA